jgi:O-antigen ligase
MTLFYWLVGVMPLDQHWLWGLELAGSFTVIKLLGLLCLLLALMRVVFGGVPFRRYYDTAQSRWFIICLMLFGLGLARTLPEMQSTAFSHMFSFLALFVTVVALVDSENRLHRTILVAIGAAAFASLYAIRQQVTSATLFEGFRAAGIFSDSNQYALVTGLWMPVALLWAFGKGPAWERLFCSGCFMVMLAGAAFAASRGGFAGLTISLIYVIARSRQSVRNLIVFGALMLPLLLTSSSSLLQRLTKPSDGDRQAQDSRLIVWRAGLRMIESQSLIGVGMHNFKSRVEEFEGPGESVRSLAHNSYLEIAAELGIPALIAFAALLWTTFRALERVRRRNQALLSSAALGLQAGLLSYLVSSFFLSAWFEKMFWLLMFLAICACRLSGQVVLARRKAEARQKSPVYSLEFPEVARAVEG